MPTETQIRTRHRAVESSSSTDLMNEKNSQAHKDRGELLAILKENYFERVELLNELRSERETTEILRRQLDKYYKEQGRRRRKVVQPTPTEPPKTH